MKLKNIRFNLKFSNGKDASGNENFTSIRSFADLLAFAKRLNIDDLYEYFKSGQLERWLKVIGEDDKSKAIEKINEKTPIAEQLKKLFTALDLKLEPGEIELFTESYVYSETIANRRKNLAADLKNISNVIRKDFEQYNECLKDIISVAEDFSAVKAKVRSLLKTYTEQFKLDWMRFYDIMIQKCPLAIFVVFMDKEFREFYLPSNLNMNVKYYGKLSSEFEVCQDVTREDSLESMSEDQDESPVQVLSTRIDKILSVKVKSNRINLVIDGKHHFASDSYLLKDGLIIKEVDYIESEGDWQDAVDRGNEVLILHCGDNIKIRSKADKRHQYTGKTLPGKFPILNGLDFCTSSSAVRMSSNRVLLYMEIK